MWLNVQTVMDWERFTPDSTIDVDFCATALYCSDNKEANMAMEVLEPLCASALVVNSG